MAKIGGALGSRWRSRPARAEARASWLATGVLALVMVMLLPSCRIFNMATFFPRGPGDDARFADTLAIYEDTSGYRYMWHAQEKVFSLSDEYGVRIYQNAWVRVQIKRGSTVYEEGSCSGMTPGAVCQAWQGTNNTSSQPLCWYFAKTWQRMFIYWDGEPVGLTWIDGEWAVRDPC